MAHKRTPVTLVRALSEAAAFRSLSPDDLRTLASRAKMLDLPAGKALVRQGSRGGDVYVVVSGTLRVALNGGGTEAEMRPGAVIGEIAHLAGGRRSATVTAKTRSRVARISAQQFARLLDEQPALGAELARAAHRRLLEKHLASALHDRFGVSDDRTLAAVAKLVEWVPLAAGDKLFDEGSIDDAAYVVASGRLRRTTHDGLVSEHGAGDVVGLESLLDDVPRAATVTAARDSYLVRLPRAAFDVIAKREPRAVAQVARTVVREATAHASGRRRAGGMSIVVLPGSDDVDVRLATTRLVEALARHGSAYHAWSARVDSALSKPGIAQTEHDGIADLRLTQWLHEREDEHSFVVYEPDATATGWTRRCLRQADLTLIVARARSGSRSRLEEAVRDAVPAAQMPRRMLVLEHSASTQLPSDTRSAMERHGCDEVVHVRDGSAPDLERLARLASGRPVALVLGGGGARGFAHLGVMRALHERGVPFDLVGGSSIGAILSTLPAMDVPADEWVPLTERRFAKLIDYTFPTVSLIKAKRITAAMQDQCGDAQIEDLWRTYFCISTNLTRAREVIHREGPLVPALRASAAVPGLLPPVRIGDDLHVDGGVLNNVPVDVVRRAYPGATIIGADVSPPVGLRAKAEFGLWVSGTKALRAKLRKRHAPPALTETLVSATVVASLRERDRCVADGVADLWLHLDTRGVGLLDFDKVAPIARKGYEEVRERIDEWLRGDDPALEPIRGR